MTLTLSLCWEAEVLQDTWTFETIPGVEEDDLNEGLKLEMRAERELALKTFS